MGNLPGACMQQAVGLEEACEDAETDASWPRAEHGRLRNVLAGRSPNACTVQSRGGGVRPVRGAGHQHSMHTPKSAAAAAHALTTASSTKIGQMVCQICSQPSLTPALQS